MNHVWWQPASEAAVHDRSAVPNRSAVHVWRIELDAPDDVVYAAAGLLSPDEQQRAHRFHFPRDRRRFTVSHAAMRSILGGYLHRAAHQVSFVVHQRGKPALAEPLAASGIRFNLSHSHEIALLAVAWQREVGVDVEQVRPVHELHDIAARFFAPPEVEQLQSVRGSADEVPAFFNCWTRKEAFIKAVGSGLHHPLDSFAVSLLPGEAAQFRPISGQPELCAGWSLLAFAPALDYAAALVVEGDEPMCTFWHFDLADLMAQPM